MLIAVKPQPVVGSRCVCKLAKWHKFVSCTIIFMLTYFVEKTDNAEAVHIKYYDVYCAISRLLCHNMILNWCTSIVASMLWSYYNTTHPVDTYTVSSNGFLDLLLADWTVLGDITTLQLLSTRLHVSIVAGGVRGDSSKCPGAITGSPFRAWVVQDYRLYRSPW